MTRADPCRNQRLALPPSEGALLWSMRAWVVGQHRGVQAEARAAEALACLGAPDAADYLFGFMFALRHGALRTIAVDCPCRPLVSGDERALLGVFALAQEDQSFEAILSLRTLVTSGAARAAYCSAEGVAHALIRAGRWLRPVSRGTSRYAALAADRAERGAMLLH